MSCGKLVTSYESRYPAKSTFFHGIFSFVVLLLQQCFLFFVRFVTCHLISEKAFHKITKYITFCESDFCCRLAANETHGPATIALVFFPFKKNSMSNGKYNLSFIIYEDIILIYLIKDTTIIVVHELQF